MELYYVNSINEKLDFIKLPYLIKEMEELEDFSHIYEVDGEEIIFEDSPAEIPLILNIYAESDEEYKNAKNRFFEITQYDVMNRKKGRLYYNGQYVECQLVGSKKKDWCMGIPYTMNYIRMLTTRPYWIRENVYSFQTSDISSTNNKRYMYRYPYRYANGMNDTYVSNPHFSDSNFKLIIYGPAVNPMVSVGGVPHLTNIVLEEDERLEIDSRAGTVVKVTKNGECVNAFHNRQKGRKFFRKIGPGRQNIVWPGTFAFDLVIFEERSEPKCS